MKNNKLIEIWYHRMWNQWDKTVFEQILSPTINFRGSLGQVKTGYNGLSDYIDFVKNAFPDFYNEIELILTEDNKSFVKLKYTGTHKGEIFNILPTNKKVEYSGAAVFIFDNNKITDVWVLGDIYGLIQQLKS